MSGDSDEFCDEAYSAGLAAGQRAAPHLPPDAPFTERQRRWLDGFLSGLFGAARPSLESGIDLAAQGAVSRQCQIAAAANAAAVSSAHRRAYHRDNPYAARIQSVNRVPGAASRWCLAAVDIEGSGIGYRPGDWLGVFPHNDPATVRQVLKLLGVRGQDEVLSARGRGPLWRALLEELDLVRSTPQLVELLARVARNRAERDSLAALAAAGFEPSLSLEALLRRFPSARPSAADVVASLRPLQAELFPIASAQMVLPHQVEVLVGAEVRDSDRGRGGGRFFAQRLRVGEWVPVFVEAGAMALPADDHEPIVMVADGVGVGLFRAFLAARAARKARGRNWLWVAGPGFSAEMDQWHRNGVLTRIDHFDPADFDAAVERSGDVLWRWLVDRTPVYVCGSNRLIEAVERMLDRLAATHGGRDPRCDGGFALQLRAAGRLVSEQLSV